MLAVNVYTAQLPVCGSVVAVVGQEVIVDLPEHMEGDPAVGGRHVVVGFPHHGIKIVEGNVLPHQLVGQAVTVH